MEHVGLSGFINITEGHRCLSEIRQGEQGLPETGGLANPIETTSDATDA